MSATEHRRLVIGPFKCWLFMSASYYKNPGGESEEKKTTDRDSNVRACDGWEQWPRVCVRVMRAVASHVANMFDRN